MSKVATNVIPRGFTATSSQGSVTTIGITYNELTATYNDSRYQYGGFYGYADFPSFHSFSLISPTLRVSGDKSLVNLLDQAITYNQGNVSYNDSRYQYGGIYGYIDIKPLISKVANPTPKIVGYADIYTTPIPPTQNSGMLIGILGLTYP